MDAMTSFREYWATAVSAVAVLMLSAPATAGLVTINFGGEVDLSSYGASSNSSLSGSLSWDSATAPVNTGTVNSWVYLLTGATTLINGVDYSGNIDLASSRISATETNIDSISAVLLYNPLLDVGTAVNDIFILNIKLFDNEQQIADNLMLPDSASFLSEVDDIDIFVRDENFDNRAVLADPSVTAGVSTVPSPTSLALIGLGLLGLRLRRNS